MQRIDFGDIDKFLVSIGLVLISLSLLLPYFYLREDFGLLIEEEQIEKFPEKVVRIINKKQMIILQLQPVLPWASGLLFITGIIFNIIGLRRWFIRQDDIDAELKLRLDKLRKEIEAMTAEERMDNIARSIYDSEVPVEGDNAAGAEEIETDVDVINEYVSVEDKVVAVFKNYQSSNYEIIAHHKLKFGSAELPMDILMRAKSKKYADRIIEIKFFRISLNLGQLAIALDELSSTMLFYRTINKRAVVPILIVVFDTASIQQHQAESTELKLRKLAENKPYLERLRLFFIAKNQITDLDVRRVLSR